MKPGVGSPGRTSVAFRERIDYIHSMLIRFSFMQYISGINMRIAIIGSRDYTNLQLVYDFVTNLPSDTTIISGGAKGVDSTAEMVARFMGFPVEIYPYNGSKDRYGGHSRNIRIVEACESLWAFWNGRSRGSWDSIRKARDAGKLTAVRLEDGSFMNWQESLWLSGAANAQPTISVAIR